MDEDIPIVMATAHVVNDPPPVAQAVGSRPVLTKGRSSRVAIKSSPTDVQPLGENETLALKDQGYTQGLIESLTTNSSVFPLRIWVVDNSGESIYLFLARHYSKHYSLIQGSFLS